MHLPRPLLAFAAALAVGLLPLGAHAKWFSAGPPPDEERLLELDPPKANTFKVKTKDREELLLLPEVLSALDFAPAAFDTSREGKLRESSFWGRLYVEGWPEPLQFMRAHFGTAPPAGRLRLVLAEPADACAPLTNKALATRAGAKDVLVVARRGGCTYGEKAAAVNATGAKNIVYVNSEDGLLHPPAPDVHDIDMSASMVARGPGSAVAGALAAGVRLHGRMVPMVCDTQAPKDLSLGEPCLPATAAGREVAAAQVAGGVATAAPSGATADYLLAKFGAGVRPGLAMALPLLRAEGTGLACLPLQAGAGAALLVKRGECTFLEKAEAALAVGAAALVLVDRPLEDGEATARPGVLHAWQAENVSIPYVIVTAAGGAALEAGVQSADQCAEPGACAGGATISFAPASVGDDEAEPEPL